jgi:hypothetical protein
MVTRNIFVEQNVQCPVCSVRVPLKYPNPRLYVADTRDTDSRVTTYRWLEGYSDTTVPHFHPVWQCPQCYFAAFNESILNPKGAKENYLREGFKALPGDAMFWMADLHKLVPKEDMDLQGAFAKHLIAAFAAQLPEVEKRDHAKLARLYLRIAWLYREAEEMAGGGGANLGSLGEMYSTSGTFRGVAAQLKTEMAALVEAAKKRIKERDALGITLNPYTKVIQNLHVRVAELAKLSDMLESAVETDNKTLTSSAASSATASLANIKKATLEVKNHWSDVPVSEREAMIKAIEAFERAITVEKAYPRGEQAMGVIAIMVDLMRRVGEYTRALEFIKKVQEGELITKSGMNEKFMKYRSTGKMSAKNESKIFNSLSAVDQAIARLAFTKRDIIEDMIKRDKEKIEKVLAASAGKTIEQQVSELTAAGIPTHIIEDMLQRNVFKEPEKKKGLFG